MPLTFTKKRFLPLLATKDSKWKCLHELIIFDLACVLKNFKLRLFI